METALGLLQKQGADKSHKNSEAITTDSNLSREVKVTADKIYTGGEIITLDDKNPSAEAVAVQSGKILAVGSLEELQNLQGDKTEVINLNGKTMVPGFIDGHGHIFLVGFSSIVANLLPSPDGDVDNITQLQDKLRSWDQTDTSDLFGTRTSDLFGLILGNGYDCKGKTNHHYLWNALCKPISPHQ
ncbi:amidohydrolase family protein [Moorena sp. SIO3I6]|uniref:amidohydrolase family protein n=1 Tax=Moorena sp. SIO3I6 TaxID=2607831 RepID=UPI0013F99DC4|nr:amidohydrolase family protein [Moorena sp. SIO3I6]NEP23121.1 amidohydrolase family protein [Moorena sp. SIO3I6]